MLSIEEVRQNFITSDNKLVSYSSTITMMHGPMYIRFNIYCSSDGHGLRVTLRLGPVTLMEAVCPYMVVLTLVFAVSTSVQMTTLRGVLN